MSENKFVPSVNISIAEYNELIKIREAVKNNTLVLDYGYSNLRVINASAMDKELKLIIEDMKEKIKNLQIVNMELWKKENPTPKRNWFTSWFNS